MDLASAAELKEILSNNNVHFDHQEEQIVVTGHAVQALVVQVSELTTQLQQLRTNSAHAPTVPNPPSAVPPADHFRLHSYRFGTAYGWINDHLDELFV